MTDNPEPTDLEKVLEAIDLMSTFQYATLGDEDALAKLKEREELPDPMKAWMEKCDNPDPDPDPDPTPDPDPDPDVDKADPPAPIAFGVEKPKLDDFDNEIEYAKALIRWDTASKAAARPTYSYKKPEKNDFFTDDEFTVADKAYKEFVKALQEDLSPVLGEAIKKSLVPEAVDPVEVDFDKIYAAADGAQTWEQFATDMEIEQ